MCIFRVLIWDDVTDTKNHTAYLWPMCWTLYLSLLSFVGKKLISNNKINKQKQPQMQQMFGQDFIVVINYVL